MLSAPAQLLKRFSSSRSSSVPAAGSPAATSHACPLPCLLSLPFLSRTSAQQLLIKKDHFSISQRQISYNSNNGFCLTVNKKQSFLFLQISGLIKLKLCVTIHVLHRLAFLKHQEGLGCDPTSLFDRCKLYLRGCEISSSSSHLHPGYPDARAGNLMYAVNSDSDLQSDWV